MPDLSALVSREEKETLLKFYPNGVMALDLETTGLSPLVDEIVEIAAVKLSPDGNLEGFDQLLKTRYPISIASQKIHGIDDAMVANMPRLNEVFPRFLTFWGDTPLIAHNAQFDMGFLIFYMHQQKIILKEIDVLCSCRLSRICQKNAPGHSLGQLADYFDIPIENQHRALDDALASLRIFARSLMSQDVSDEVKLKSAKLLSLNDYQKNRDLTLPKELELLREVVGEQTPVMIVYKGGSLGKNERPIRPVGLLPMPAGNILYAHCLLSDQYKSFALKKIASVRKCSNKELNEYSS